MKLKIKHIYILFVAIAMSISCSKQDNIPTDTLTLANFDVALDATMSDYAEDNTAVTKAPSATWKDGDEIAFALDGSAKPAGKLKYNAASGTWSKSEINSNAPVKSEGGTVCAIHSEELNIDINKEGAECKGNIVYSDSGTYKVAKGVIYFMLNLNKRVESKLIISGVNAKAKVLNVKNKRISSFAGMKFEDYDGTGEGIYDAETKTLTVEGSFADNGAGKTTIKIVYTEGENIGKAMTRTYEKKAGAGQSITIKGPDDAEQSGNWTDAGFEPVSIMLINPETEEYYTEGQLVICAQKQDFARVVILPENAADKSFTISSKLDSGEEMLLVDHRYNILYTKFTGKGNVTITTSNGIKTTLKLNIYDNSFYVDGFRFSVLLGGGVEIMCPDLEGKYYGTVEPAYSGDVVLPATVNYADTVFQVLGLGNRAFEAANDKLNDLVTSITFGENMTFMRSTAIKNLPNLTKVKINRKMQDLRFNVSTPFCYCQNLNTIEVEEGNEYYSVEDGVLYGRASLDQNIHHYCYMVIPQYTQPIVVNGNTKVILDDSMCHLQTTSVEIPSSVIDLGQFLFGGDSSKITKVKLPWTYQEMRQVKISGSWQTAITELYQYFFNRHPDKQSVYIYVPSGNEANYRNSYWGRSINNTSGESRFIGY